MNRKTVGGWLTATVMSAAVVSALMAGSLTGTASAGEPVPADEPSPSASAYVWWGAGHPGSGDPGDPNQNDWHCDRAGNWHNTEDDPDGHSDSRCQAW